MNRNNNINNRSFYPYLSIFYAIVSAILLKFTFPPFYITGLGFIALIPLIKAVGESNPRKAFYLGLTFGLVFFSTILWWLIPTIHRYGNIPIIAAIAILGCLVFYLSLYPAIWALISSIWISKKDIPSFLDIITISSLWVILEWIRGHILTGFPWGILGCSLITSPPFIQTASFLGMYWISFWIIFVNCLLCSGLLFILDSNNKKYIKSIAYIGLALLTIISFYYYGKILIKNCKNSDQKYKSLNVVAVQGNIAQNQKWSKTFQQKTFDIYRKLTISAVDKIKHSNQNIKSPLLIIWPETAMPFFFQDPSDLKTQILDLAKATKSLILLGAPSYKLVPNSSDLDIKVKYFNSAFLVSPEGIVVGRYDKQHLVPFGEYLPFGCFTAWARKIIGAIGAFSPGKHSSPLCWKNIKIGVLICFESIFPHIAVRFVKNGANLLAVITDDAWFGNTEAPYEHADMAVFRAIETRRYIVRAANTGESLIITPWGKKIKKSPLFTPYYIYAKIRLRNDLTLYDKIEENWLLPFLLLVLLNLVKSKDSFRQK